MAEAPATRTPVLTPLLNVSVRRQRFLWNNRIPMQTLGIFAGRGGEGKSTFGNWVASGVTRGTLDGELRGIPSNVMVIGQEDDLATVVVPRLKAAGADLGRVTALSIKTTFEGIDTTEVPSLAEDIARTEQAIIATGAKLVIYDPLTSAMEGVNLDKTSEVRRGTNVLAALAAKLDISIIAIMHFRKGQGDTRDLLSGSHAFRDVARSVILFATDEQTGQRVGTVDKSNYSESRGDSFAFNLVSTSIPTEAGDFATVARVEYLGESNVSVSDIVNRAPEPELGEEIGLVVDCVNRHPEGIKPAAVAEETDIHANAVRTYLVRAEKRDLIAKVGYGTYYPKATAPTASTPVAPVAPVALNTYRATKATGATEQQHSAPVALCRICDQPLHPSITTGAHANCE